MNIRHVDGQQKGRVLVYALSTCIWCKMTKSLLRELNVAYDFVDVDQLEDGEKDQVRATVKKWNPVGNYPTIVIDDRECLAGYDEDKIRARFA